MRTTLTLDEDVADKLKAQMQRSGKSFKSVVNEALRRYFRRQSVAPPRSTFKVMPHKSEFVAGVDIEKLNQLNDELDALDVL